MNRRNSQTDQQIQVFRVHTNIRWETRFRGQEEHRHGLGYMQEIESQHNDQEHHLKQAYAWSVLLYGYECWTGSKQWY